MSRHCSFPKGTALRKSKLEVCEHVAWKDGARAGSGIVPLVKGSPCLKLSSFLRTHIKMQAKCHACNPSTGGGAQRGRFMLPPGQPAWLSIWQAPPPPRVSEKQISKATVDSSQGTILEDDS